MVDHVVKKHVTLREPVTGEAPDSKEQRLIGDTAGWGEAGAGSRPEGDVGWRSEVLLEPGAFLQASTQWKAQGLPKGDAAPQPLPGEELRPPKPATT